MPCGKPWDERLEWASLTANERTLSVMMVAISDGDTQMVDDDNIMLMVLPAAGWCHTYEWVNNYCIDAPWGKPWDERLEWASLTANERTLSVMMVAISDGDTQMVDDDNIMLMVLPAAGWCHTYEWVNNYCIDAPWGKPWDERLVNPTLM